MSERSEPHVTLVEVNDFVLALDIRDLLHGGGLPEVNVRPVPTLHPQIDYEAAGPFAVRVPEGRLTEAQELLRESGLLEL